MKRKRIVLKNAIQCQVYQILSIFHSHYFSTFQAVETVDIRSAVSDSFSSLIFPSYFSDEIKMNQGFSSRLPYAPQNLSLFQLPYCSKDVKVLTIVHCRQIQKNNSPSSFSLQPVSLVLNFYVSSIIPAGSIVWRRRYWPFFVLFM